MKIYMIMKVEGFDAGHADAKVEIDDELLRYFVRKQGAKHLAGFIASEITAYVEGMAQKNIDNGAIQVGP